MGQKSSSNKDGNVDASVISVLRSPLLLTASRGRDFSSNAVRESLSSSFTLQLSELISNGFLGNECLIIWDFLSVVDRDQQNVNTCSFNPDDLLRGNFDDCVFHNELESWTKKFSQITMKGKKEEIIKLLHFDIQEKRYKGNIYPTGYDGSRDSKTRQVDTLDFRTDSNILEIKCFLIGDEGEENELNTIILDICKVLKTGFSELFLEWNDLTKNRRSTFFETINEVIETREYFKTHQSFKSSNDEEKKEKSVEVADVVVDKKEEEENAKYYDSQTRYSFCQQAVELGVISIQLLMCSELLERVVSDKKSLEEFSSVFQSDTIWGKVWPGNALNHMYQSIGVIKDVSKERRASMKVASSESIIRTLRRIVRIEKNSKTVNIENNKQKIAKLEQTVLLSKEEDGEEEDPKEVIMKYIELGVQFLKSGDYRSSIEIFTKIIGFIDDPRFKGLSEGFSFTKDLVPWKLHSYYCRGNVYFRMREYHKAMEDFEIGFERHGKVDESLLHHVIWIHQEIIFKKGLCFFHLGDQTKAFNQFGLAPLYNLETNPVIRKICEIQRERVFVCRKKEENGLEGKEEERI